MKYCFPSPFHTAGPPLSPWCDTFTITKRCDTFTISEKGKIFCWKPQSQKSCHLTSVDLAVRVPGTEHVVGDLGGSVAEKESNVTSMIPADLLGPTSCRVCTSSVILLAPTPPAKVKRCHCCQD